VNGQPSTIRQNCPTEYNIGTEHLHLCSSKGQEWFWGAAHRNIIPSYLFYQKTQKDTHSCIWCSFFL